MSSVDFETLIREPALVMIAMADDNPDVKPDEAESVYKVRIDYRDGSDTFHVAEDDLEEVKRNYADYYGHDDVPSELDLGHKTVIYGKRTARVNRDMTITEL